MIPTWGAQFGANAIFNSAEFRADLTHSAIPDKAAPGTTGTFTRATTSTWPNNDGYTVTGVAGEIGFVGARRVRNLVPLYSQDLTKTAQWTPTGTASVSSSTVALFPANNDLIICTNPTGRTTKTVGNKYIFSFKVSGSGTLDFYLNDGVGEATLRVTLTSTPTVYSISRTAVAGGIALINCYFGRVGSTATSVTVDYVQLEDVTAQTTQTAGEYVSVGALDYRSELNPLYLSLPGTAGHYASTPNAAANQVTGSFDIVADASLPSLATYGALVAKWNNNAAQSSYLFIKSADTLVFIYSVAGVQYTATSASLATAGVLVNNRYLFKVSRNATTGGVNFYYSSNQGAGYTQIGSTVAGTSGTLTTSTLIVEIGSQATGTGGNLVGSVYGAKIYSTIGGTTPVVDFNPHRDATTPTGTITSSTTGEVWTINGASSVVRSDYYHGSFVDGVKCFPTDISGNPIPSTTLLGSQEMGARTNLCLQSNAFTTAPWAATGTPAGTQNLIGPDGATSGWTVTDNDAGAAEFYSQSGLTLTAATYTLSAFFKKTTGALTGYPVLQVDNGGGALMAGCTVDTSAGVATLWTSYPAFTIQTSSARCTSFNADWWRVELTFLATATNWNTYVAPAFRSTANSSTGANVTTATNALGVYGFMLELGSFASPYIATTTIAVTRNADVLTYSSAGNILGTAGWCYAEVVWPNSINGMRLIATDVASDYHSPLAYSSGTGKILLNDGTADRQLGAFTPSSSQQKIATSWGGTSASSSVNGTVSSPATFDGDIGVSATIYVGAMASAGAAQPFGTIRNLRIGQRQLSTSEQGAITA